MFLNDHGRLEFTQGVNVFDRQVIEEFETAWRVGPSGLRPLFKKYPADVSAEAIQVVLDEAGWDSDYGPVIEAVPEGAILERAVGYMNDPQLKKPGIVLPVEGIKDIAPYLARAEPEDQGVEWPDAAPEEDTVFTPPIDAPDDQYAMNAYRLGHYLLADRVADADFYDEGIHAFFDAITRYEKAYKVAAPWYPVLPHHTTRTGINLFLNEAGWFNDWSLETAPVLWEMDRETFAANYNPELQQWWLSTGLRSLWIVREFDLTLSYKDSYIQRFSINGVSATAIWRWGYDGIEEADPVQMVRSIHEQTLNRVAQRRKVPPAPFPR